MVQRTESCAIAFKEWSGVCDALMMGIQSIILRKGGIRESPGPGQFEPEHDEFWLYPTAVHQAEQGLRIVRPDPSPLKGLRQGCLPIRALARVEIVGHLRNEEKIRELEEFHILTPDTIRKRFQYRTPGLWVLGARIWRTDHAFAIMATPEHAGCKTWVTLDPPLSTLNLVAAIDDATWSSCVARLRSILDGESMH